MAHPQQGLVQANDLPVGTWYELDVDKPYPEGNIRYYCSKCGGKNRMDYNWRYCRDPLHAARTSATIARFALLGTNSGLLGGFLGVDSPFYDPPCLLKYECAYCRGDDKRRNPHEEDPDEEEEEEEEEKEEEDEKEEEEEEEQKEEKADKQAPLPTLIRSLPKHLTRPRRRKRRTSKREQLADCSAAETAAVASNQITSEHIVLAWSSSCVEQPAPWIGLSQLSRNAGCR